MDVVDLLAELGGVARRSALLRVVTRKDIEIALAAGLINRAARGLYTLPGIDEAVRTATQLGGVLSLTSAALRHGWAVKTVPDKPHVTLSRGRSADDAKAHLHWAELRPDQIDGPATSVELTLEQCLRHLPFDEALAIADSALREGMGRSTLERIADKARGPGSPQIRRVVALASPLRANPFESVLAAICDSVPGLDMRPQVTISDGDFSVRPDLVDEQRRIIAEADSFEWHGGRAALASDARRYNMLVINGWIVLRFSYEDVMFHPEEVRRVLVAAVALTELMGEVGLLRRLTA